MGKKAGEWGYKNYKLTATEISGRKRADMATWRTKLQASKIKFDDEQKGVYLNVLAKTGRRSEAALAARVSLQTVLTHRDNDPDFEDAFQSALGQYQDVIHTLAFRLMNGVKKPIIGGQHRDRIVAHEVVYATNLLAMELRRTNAEYKERSEVAVNNRGGVLMVPADMSIEDFIAKERERTMHKKEPGVDI